MISLLKSIFNHDIFIFRQPAYEKTDGGNILGKVLMILEVSQKQNYIFSSKNLSENVTRSEQIACVTSSKFFPDKAGAFYCEEKNLIYVGGGHAVLQFACQDQAKSFAHSVTRAVLENFPGMELFVKQYEYQEKSPKENLEALTKELEKKKSRRERSFRYLSLGVEDLDSVSFYLCSSGCSKASSKKNICHREESPQTAGRMVFPGQL